MAADKEPADSETIGAPDDATGILSSALGNVNWRTAILLFVVFMLISSDVFVERLNSISGAVDGRFPTGKGTVIQGLTLALAYIVLDVLVRAEVI
jgi:hypothetical protein